MTKINSRRSRRPLSKASQVDIFQRDEWLCHWCKKPVLFAPVMRVLELELRGTGYADQLAYFHPHWTRDGAPLLDELGAVIDHIAPFSKDGPDTEENLITACNKCNGRKNAALLDEWNKRPIRNPIVGKYGEPQHWDGLASVFVMLAQRNLSKLTKVDKDWFIALKQGK